MIRLDAISLVQFKNYAAKTFEFTDRIVGICGRNGIGKTNLLDAIHYLCFTKSYFTRLDHLNVQHGRQGFRIEGKIILNDETETAVCVFRETGKKEFQVNGVSYERFADHIGRYPCVIIAPDDMQIITGSNEERRRFLDALLSQLDAEYLTQLITYNRLLLQRNSLLKSEDSQRDLSLLDVLDDQMAKPADKIFEKRKKFLLSFLPEVKNLYLDIARQFEHVSLIYHSELMQGGCRELLAANRARDINLQRTTCGIHRDDLLLTLDEQPFRNIASQGQRKSLLFALKLAEMEVLRKNKGFAPLLLLDDVFEKLDDERISNLLERVCNQNEGQVFITDTSEQRLKLQLKAFQLIDPG